MYILYLAVRYLMYCRYFILKTKIYRTLAAGIGVYLHRIIFVWEISGLRNRRNLRFGPWSHLTYFISRTFQCNYASLGPERTERSLKAGTSNWMCNIFLTI